MKPWGWVAIGILSGLVGGLFAAGAIFLLSSPPRGEAVILIPPPTASPLLVHVSGSVNQPGMVALPPGSRVKDAIAAAGGVCQGDEQAVNLAAVVQDGEKIWVPPIPEASVQTTGEAAEIGERFSSAIQPSLPSAPGIPGKININTASQEELDELPGIGKVLAERIVQYRIAHGPFAQIEGIKDVSGIGDALFERMKDLITIGK